MSEIGKQWTSDAVCYHLEPTIGHIVGTIMRRCKGIHSRSKEGLEKYGVVWEFTGLGETTVLITYLLEGHITAQKMLMERQKIKVISNIDNEIERKFIYRPNELSDDEECMKVSSTWIIYP
jgi:hypothetical protein